MAECRRCDGGIQPDVAQSERSAAGAAGGDCTPDGGRRGRDQRMRAGSFGDRRGALLVRPAWQPRGRVPAGAGRRGVGRPAPRRTRPRCGAAARFVTTGCGKLDASQRGVTSRHPRPARRRLARVHFPGRGGGPAPQLRRLARRRRVHAPRDASAHAARSGLGRRRDRQVPAQARRAIDVGLSAAGRGPHHRAVAPARARARARTAWAF